VLVLLLHFSIAVSKLAEQNKVLAQRLALLEERQREAGSPAGRRFGDAAARLDVEAEDETEEVLSQ
jgi:hypothetical protein